MGNIRRLLDLTAGATVLENWAAGAAAPPAPIFRAGAATSNITPPLGRPIVGNFVAPLSTNVHDELHARCLVLDDGKTKLALVVCDVLGLHRSVSVEARRLIQERAWQLLKGPSIFLDRGEVAVTLAVAPPPEASAALQADFDAITGFVLSISLTNQPAASSVQPAVTQQAITPSMSQPAIEIATEQIRVRAAQQGLELEGDLIEAGRRSSGNGRGRRGWLGHGRSSWCGVGPRFGAGQAAGGGTTNGASR